MYSYLLSNKTEEENRLRNAILSIITKATNTIVSFSESIGIFHATYEQETFDLFTVVTELEPDLGRELISMSSQKENIITFYRRLLRIALKNIFNYIAYSNDQINDQSAMQIRVEARKKVLEGEKGINKTIISIRLPLKINSVELGSLLQQKLVTRTSKAAELILAREILSYFSAMIHFESQTQEIILSIPHSQKE